MNSTKLIKKFPDVYKNFFSKNSIVISTPFIVNRCDDMFPYYSGVSIKQKIPLRLYIGIEKNNTDEINFNKIQYRDNGENGFIGTDMFSYAPYFYNIKEIINQKYPDFVKKNGGYDINILSELGRGKGLGFDHLVSVCILILLNRILGKVDSDKLVKINQIPINEVINNQYLGIKDILMESFEIDHKIYGKTFFARKIGSIFDSSYPIIGFTGNIFSYGIENDKNDLSYNRFGFRLNELFEGLRDIPYFPMDRGILYTGKPVLLEQIINKNLIDINAYDDIIKDFKKTFNGLFDDLTPNKKPKFFTNFLEGNKGEIAQTYGKMMGIISLEILYFMYNLYSQGYSEKNTSALVASLTKTKYGNYITRENSNSLVSFFNKFLGNMATSRNLIAVFPNDTTIMGGSVCFLMPSEGFRKIVFDSIEHTKKEYISIDLLYANRLDGTESQGLRFEQDIQNGIFSNFLNGNSYVVKSNKNTSIFGDYEDCLKKSKEGILLDTINNKIYLNGQKLTSQQIHSQTATVEILMILMKNIGKDISNTDLPISSYSKNKNEMLGKIILPLIELIKKESGKKLPLICKGSIYDFFVKLNKCDINISTIEKIG